MDSNTTHPSASDVMQRAEAVTRELFPELYTCLSDDMVQFNKTAAIIARHFEGMDSWREAAGMALGWMTREYAERKLLVAKLGGDESSEEYINAPKQIADALRAALAATARKGNNMKTKTKRIKARSRTKTIVRWVNRYPQFKGEFAEFGALFKSRKEAKQNQWRRSVECEHLPVTITLPAPKKTRGL